MGEKPVWKLLLSMAPPLMAALLIQSIYNIVDSYFISSNSVAGLTALSIIFPIQQFMIALSFGSGVGLNILVSRLDGREKETNEAEHDIGQSRYIRCGLVVGLVNFIAFTAVGLLIIRPFMGLSTDSAEVFESGVTYGSIVMVGSLGLFVESMITKVIQARGNMVVPTIAQSTGAIINIILDPILIFGHLGCPKLGIAGAAIATVIGQWTALLIVAAFAAKTGLFRSYAILEDTTAVLAADTGNDVEKETGYGKNPPARSAAGCCFDIYREGLANIVMQSLYTVYIIGLNLILKSMTEDAVTVLGIYYKLQTFFFIPIMAMTQVVVPVVSYNYGAALYDRVKTTVKWAMGFSGLLMTVAMAVFLLAPGQLLGIFSPTEGIVSIGVPALRVISFSFLPAVFVMMLNMYFMGTERGKYSISISMLRQVFLLVPLGWIFHYMGINWFWLTFPVTELITLLWCLILLNKSGISQDKEPEGDGH